MDQLLSKNIFWFVFISIPLTFTIGIAVTEVFVLLSILFFFYQNKNLDYFKNKIFLFLFLFSIYIAVNSIIQIPHSDLKIKTIFHFRFLIFSVSILFILDYFKNEISKSNNLLKFILCFIFLLIFDVLLQFFSGQNIFGLEIIKNRISGIFGDDLILGSFFLKILPLVLWLIYYVKFDLKKNQNLLYIFFSLYFITIYLSGERTSLMLLFISLFVYFIFLKTMRKIIKISLIIFLLFMTLTSFVNLGKTDPSKRIFVKTFNQIQSKYYWIKNGSEQSIVSKSTVEWLGEQIIINDKKSSKKINNTDNKIIIFSEDHNGHYILALNLFKESVIFGKGPGGFRSHCRIIEYNSDVGMCSTHPHNFLIQILAETGLIGFVIYFFGLFFVLIKLIQHYEKGVKFEDKSCFAVCSVAILINFFPLLPSGNFFNNWIMIINYYYIGLYLHEYNKTENL